MDDAIVVSDLHLGSDICQAKTVAHFLNSLADSPTPPQRLILNGDVFDSMNFTRLRKWHWKALSQLRKLSDRIETVWVVGNHDGPADFISHLLGVSVRPEYCFDAGGRRILVQHGHQYDRFIDDHPVLTWFADVAYWFFQSIDPSHRIARFSKRSSKTFLRCVKKVEEAARETARRRGFDAVICGHTHQAVHKTGAETGDIDYINTGCWTERPCSYLSVRAGEFHLRNYQPDLDQPQHFAEWDPKEELVPA